MNDKLDFKYLHFNIVQYNNSRHKHNDGDAQKIELILDNNQLKKILNVHKLRPQITNIKIKNQLLWTVNCQRLQFTYSSFDGVRFK